MPSVDDIVRALENFGDVMATGPQDEENLVSLRISTELADGVPTANDNSTFVGAVRKRPVRNVIKSVRWIDSVFYVKSSSSSLR